MIVRLRIEVSDEALREIRRLQGRDGLATRSEVRAYVEDHVDSLAERHARSAA